MYTRLPMKMLLGALFLALLIPLSVVAHGGEEEADELPGYEVDIHPQEALQGDEVPLEARILKEELPLQGTTVTLTVDRHEEEISDRLETQEREPGSYVASYRFEKAGEYEIHIEFVDSGETKRVTRYVNVLPMGWATPGRLFGIGTFGLAVLALIVGFARRRWKIGVGIALVLLIAGGIAYSLYVTVMSGAASRGVVTCVSENDCFLTAHVHVYVPIEICGEELRLPIETGSLTGPHTHEEKNIAHWHDRLPYDKTADVPKDLTPFTLKAFFDALQIPFSETHIATMQDGSLCNGAPATLKMFVNGVENKEYERYVWSDKDVVVIIFDARTPEEIETLLNQNPILFPSLGRG